MTRFIVVADSHIRFPDDDVETYPSNAHMVARNKYVVEFCNQIEASFVVHLGDTEVPQAHTALRDFRAAGARLLGCIATS